MMEIRKALEADFDGIWVHPAVMEIRTALP